MDKEMPYYRWGMLKYAQMRKTAGSDEQIDFS